MKCPKCSVEMKEGIACPDSVQFRVKYGWRSAFSEYHKNVHLKIVKCWKCPKCGHSEDLKNGQ